MSFTELSTEPDSPNAPAPYLDTPMTEALGTPIKDAPDTPMTDAPDKAPSVNSPTIDQAMPDASAVTNREFTTEDPAVRPKGTISVY